MQNERRHTILIVDDSPENIDVLGGILDKDYKIKFALDGSKALRIAQAENPPDLVLLDIMMPVMDGFETCRKIKEIDGLSDMPIIFISALQDVEKKLEAFACGGVDFVDKPFWPEEVKARVATHLKLKEQNRELARRLERLRELEQLRDDLVHMVVHDMRSPIGIIRGYLKMLRQDAEGLLDEDQMESITEAISCTVRLNDMAESLLDVSRLESGQMPIRKAPCDLVQLAAQVAENPGSPFSGRKVRLADLPETVRVECDCELIRRVLHNLVGNALKFTPSSGEVSMEITRTDNLVCVSVKDTGEGIPDEFLDRVFCKFVSRQSAQIRKKYCSTGLGLAFCKLAVEAHGGNISVDSQLGAGSCFRFTLPICGD